MIFDWAGIMVSDSVHAFVVVILTLSAFVDSDVCVLFCIRSDPSWWGMVMASVTGFICTLLFLMNGRPRMPWWFAESIT